MTNYEKIMSELTVEKLAMKMDDYCEDCENCPVYRCDIGKTCKNNIRKWLESEVSENDEL